MSAPFNHVKAEAESLCHHCYRDSYITNDAKGFLAVKYVTHYYYVCRAKSSNSPPDDRSNTTPCSFTQMGICPIAKCATIIPEGRPMGGGMA